MTFSIFIPEQSGRTSAPPPVLYYLSGLTCNDENAKTKGFIFHHAAKWGLAVVIPDTSARGVVVEGQNDHWDFGDSAGYYLNATEDKWKANWNMADYVTKELPQVVDQLFKVDNSRRGVSGHSTGGHGAMVNHFRNPGMFKSVSAFAPMCNPSNC
jgi:S-formylglutathione hydrolase